MAGQSLPRGQPVTICQHSPVPVAIGAMLLLRQVWPTGHVLHSRLIPSRL